MAKADASYVFVEWPTLRSIVLARDGFHCRECDSTEEAYNLDVHHVIPRFLGGLDDISNLITLCDGCHAARHPNLQVSLSRRLIVRWGLRLARWLDTQRELPENLDSILGGLKLLGQDRLREGQLDAILAAIRGESVLIVRPTGFGKSLCFQLPALMRPGGALVLSPLKALMQDQVSKLLRLKVPVSFINSDLSRAEKDARIHLWEHAGFKLLYCAPERFDPALVNPAEINRIARVKPTFLVVDEAHCVVRWGQDFRPAYAQIGKIRERLGNPPVLAFTATASPSTQKRILESIGVPAAKRLLADIDRPNITLIRLKVAGDKTKAKIVAALLQQIKHGRSLIFVPTKKVGEKVRSAFALLGRELLFYHGNLPLLERERILGCFTGRLEPKLDTVICTNAFGMGIDVSDIRVVVHWQHPASVEDYLQELGRAGRDGKRSIAILFTAENKERDLLKWMADRTLDSRKLSDEEIENIKKMRFAEIDAMGELAQSIGCFRRGILEYMCVDTRKYRRSISRWLIDLIFSHRVRPLRSWFCCDACDRVMTESIQNCKFSFPEEL